MRFITMIMTSAAILLLASTTPAQAAPNSDVASAVRAVPFAPVALTIAAVQESQPPAEVKVEISTNKGGGGTWYTQPIWLAIGGLAFLVIILFVVMAARGGRNNTTVVK